uniref:uncharacterized protein LOC122586136 n=1 Tax=Erigeron canadensis TaxID=72917 RepID=UPI001CB990F3|nr:uncharacterized protein LOC122586136 [Erigeron canadensis]
MGCGKSKHAVETATTVLRKSDGGKETHITTKTVTEKGDASLVQQVETKSSVDEDTKNETTITKVDTIGVANTDKAAPVSGDNVGKVTEVVKEDEKVKDTNPTHVNNATTKNVVPTSSKDDVSATKVVKGEEKKEANLVTDNEAKLDKVSPTLSKDDVGVTEVVNEDNEQKEPKQQITHDEIKIDSVPPIEAVETKESSLTKENNVKTEFMTPRTGEDVVEATEVVKGDAEIKDTKEEIIESVISSDKSVETVDDSSNFKDTSPKVEEQMVVVPAVESAEVEPTEEEDVKVTKVDLANVETSIATEPEKVSRLNEASVAETTEKKP